MAVMVVMVMRFAMKLAGEEGEDRERRRGRMVRMVSDGGADHEEGGDR